MSFERDIVIYLKSCEKAYTMDLYKVCGGKIETGLSLNKFRLFLLNMEKIGTIVYVTNSKYPFWKLV